MTETVLEVQRLRKYFPIAKGLFFSRTGGWVRAVDDVSFSIQNGKTCALVGESGCGKTTTARLVLHLERPTSGTILFRGNDVAKLKGDELRRYRSSVQSVFQDPYGSLDPRMRVGSIVAEPMEAIGAMSREKTATRVKQLLMQVGLSQKSERMYPHEFSGGQRQRIALARALALSPALVVLDEPVSALDVSIRADIMNLLVELQQQSGVAYMLIAHNLATVRHMSHKVCVMYLGKIVEMGETEEIYSHPLHFYTQALLSAALPFHPKAPREEVLLSGEVPSPINPPRGCRFHPRCKGARPVCSETEPSLREVDVSHFCACHIC